MEFLTVFIISLLFLASMTGLIIAIHRRRQRESRKRILAALDKATRDLENTIKVMSSARSGGKSTAFSSAPRRPHSSAQTGRTKPDSDTQYAGYPACFPFTTDGGSDDGHPRSIDRVTGHGGSFDGAGASSSWDASPCSTESRSYSSDSGSSSSSDSGSCSSSSSD